MKKGKAKFIKKEPTPEINVGLHEDCHDVTVCLPVFNSGQTVMAALNSLRLQEIPKINLFIADNGSKDGTPEMLETVMRNNLYPHITMRVVRMGDIAGGKTANIPFMRQEMSKQVFTPYIFWLDSDVMLSPNSIKPVVAMFKADPKLGLLAIRYEPNKDHPSMGATVMRTEVCKKIAWKWDDRGCDCKNACEQVVQMGLDARYHPDIMARHVKFL